MDLAKFFLWRELEDQGLDEMQHRKKRAFEMLSHFGIIPSRETIRECPRCGRELRAVSDRSRSVGYRFKCSSGHFVVPTMNTFSKRP